MILAAFPAWVARLPWLPWAEEPTPVGGERGDCSGHIPDRSICSPEGPAAGRRAIAEHAYAAILFPPHPTCLRSAAVTLKRLFGARASRCVHATLSQPKPEPRGGVPPPRGNPEMAGTRRSAGRDCPPRSDASLPKADPRCRPKRAGGRAGRPRSGRRGDFGPPSIMVCRLSGIHSFKAAVTIA
jgi:hypothetical protein